jgi:peptidoglycan/LPS O-acetylase OafA/YrhL
VTPEIASVGSADARFSHLRNPDHAVIGYRIADSCQGHAAEGQMPASQRQSARIAQLQSLRFVAAMLVMFGHVLMEARQHGATISDALYLLPWGIGVDIFFVISGFIITYVGRAASTGIRAAGDFMIRRVIRIAPLYWIFTFLMAAVILIAPEKLKNASLTASDFFTSLLFIPYTPPGLSVFRPVLDQGWTLIFEMFFYLTFSVALCLTRRRSLLCGTVMLALVGIATVAELTPALEFLFSPMLLLFLGGLALAELRERLPVHSGAMVALLTIISVAWVVMIPGDDDPLNMWRRFVQRGIPAFLLIYAFVMWRRPATWATSGLLPLLGDASYSLYLSHPFTVNAALLAFSALGLPLGFGFYLTASTVAIGVSVAAFFVLEKPMLGFGLRLYRGEPLRRSQVSEATAQTGAL